MGDRHRPNTDGFLYPSILLTKTLISKGVTIPSGDCDRADLLICSNNMVVATVMMVLVASCEYIQIYIYTHSFMTCLHCFQSLVTSWDETGRSSPKQLSLRQERTVSLPEDALELSKVEDLWTCWYCTRIGKPTWLEFVNYHSHSNTSTTVHLGFKYTIV